MTQVEPPGEPRVVRMHWWDRGPSISPLSLTFLLWGCCESQWGDREHGVAARPLHRLCPPPPRPETQFSPSHHCPAPP